MLRIICFLSALSVASNLFAQRRILTIHYNMDGKGIDSSYLHMSTIDQMEDHTKWKDSVYYPQINYSDELFKKLLKVAKYPELARRRKMQPTIEFSLMVDTSGHIHNVKRIDYTNSIFDTIATQLILQTDGFWSPAIRDGVKKSLTVSTEVSYDIYRDLNGKSTYLASILGLPSLTIDSSYNSSACFTKYDTTRGTSFYYNKIQRDGSEIIKTKKYGTVTVGFDVDTFGNLSEMAIVNSVLPEYDNDALKYLKSTQGKWLPAIRLSLKKEN